jgi:antitoxin VapB
VASLYIKDEKTAALVADAARRAGRTKTAVVREAVAAFMHQLPQEKTASDFAKRWAEYRRLNPLPPMTGLKADKAFYDSLYGDDDVA